LVEAAPRAAFSSLRLVVGSRTTSSWPVRSVHAISVRRRAPSRNLDGERAGDDRRNQHRLVVDLARGLMASLMMPSIAVGCLRRVAELLESLQLVDVRLGFFRMRPMKRSRLAACPIVFGRRFDDPGRSACLPLFRCLLKNRPIVNAL
jgi:hypothetical protein